MEKLPKAYLELIKKVESRINRFAYTYIPKMYHALRKAGFEIQDARDRVVDDGQKWWEYNTIRKWLPTEAKNQKKGNGGREAALARKENQFNKDQYSRFVEAQKDVDKIMEAATPKHTHILRPEDVGAIIKTSMQDGTLQGVDIEFKDGRFIGVSLH